MYSIAVIFKFCQLSRNEFVNFSFTEKCPYQLRLRVKIFFLNTYPANNCLFKVIDRNTRKRFGICSKLIMKTAERRHWVVCCVFFNTLINLGQEETFLVNNYNLKNINRIQPKLCMIRPVSFYLSYINFISRTVIVSILMG